jgi:hypothetical protein
MPTFYNRKPLHLSPLLHPPPPPLTLCKHQQLKPCRAGSSSSFAVTLDLRIPPQLCPPRPAFQNYHRFPQLIKPRFSPRFRVQTALMTVIKFGWIQFICIYFLLWWASEHFLRFLLSGTPPLSRFIPPPPSTLSAFMTSISPRRFLFVHRVVPVRHVAPVKLHSH